MNKVNKSKEILSKKEKEKDNFKNNDNENIKMNYIISHSHVWPQFFGEIF